MVIPRHWRAARNAPRILSLTATPISGTQINLSWTVDAGNVGLAGFKIYVNGALYLTLPQNPNMLSAPVIGLTPATSYRFAIAPYDTLGIEYAAAPVIIQTTQVPASGGIGSVTVFAPSAAGHGDGAALGAGVTNAVSAAVGSAIGGSGAAAGAPAILFLDVHSAPTSGGENGLGGYFRVCGINFGAQADLGTAAGARVYVNNIEVANYRAHVPTKCSGRIPLTSIICQLGSLGGLAVGTPGAVKVVVNGVSSNTNLTFTPTSGRVIFASLTGNDATAVVNDITKPWRHLQNGGSPATSDVYKALGAGDQVVVRGGSWSDSTGVDATWMRWSAGGTWPAKNGTPSAYISLTVYPGPILGHAPEAVNYTTPAGTSGGFSGPWSAIEGQSGRYVSYSGFHMACVATADSDAAPFNLQSACGPWRCVDNEMGPWPVAGVSAAKGAGIAGHGLDVQVLGCYIHDIAGTSALENHGIYADSKAARWQIAYNHIKNITGGSAIQMNDNEAAVGQTIPVANEVWLGFTGFDIHHNFVEVCAKYGVNFNDQGGAGGLYSGNVYNNVFIGTGLPPFRVSHGGTPSADLLFAFNTCYDCMRSTAGILSYFSDEWQGNANCHFHLYHNIFAFGPNTRSGTDFESINASPAMDRKGNCYYNNGQSAVAPAADATKITANPLFTSAATNDLSLQATSPCLNLGIQTLPYSLVVNDDIFLIARPQGAARDLGAIERPS